MVGLDTENDRGPGSLMKADDPRFARAVFTVHEAARYLGVPRSTLRSWVQDGGGGGSMVTCVPRQSDEATMPFIGFAEAYVLAAFRKAGVPMQRIRPAVAVVVSTIGIEHALASEKLYTDGAEVLFDYASARDGDLLGLTVVRTGQRQFAGVVRDYLKRITYGRDGWASRLRLPVYERAEVIVDPRLAFGLPVTVNGGARVEDLVDRFVAGDRVADIAIDFGTPEEDVEDVIRVATRAAATAA